MNMKRKLICGLLCLSMVLSLAACGGSKEDTSNSADTFVYVPTYTQMSQNFENGIYTTVYNNGWFYFLSETMVDSNGNVISNSASGTDVVAYASDEAVDGEDVAEEAEEEEKDFLQKFAFVCMLSFDVYVKKQVIEKIVDGMAEANKKDKK